MMKKTLAIVLTLALLLPTSMVFAGEENDPLGVTLIAGPEEEDSEQVSLDDVKVGKEIDIEGFGTLKFSSCEIKDKIAVDNRYENNFSGNEADYLCLFCDILNTNTKQKDYLASVEVKATYDEVYEYAGWAFQINYDFDKDYFISHDNGDRYYLIDPMYSGHYVFGATLPNAVLNGSKERKLEIKIDGNELTYYDKKS